MGRVLLYASYYVASAFISQNFIAILITIPLLCLILVSVYQIKSNNFVLDDIFWFVIFLFFCVNTVQRYTDDGYFIDGPLMPIKIGSMELMNSQFIVIVFSFIYSRTIAILNQNEVADQRKNLTTTGAAYLAIGCIIFTVLFIPAAGGISNILVPRYDQDASERTIYASIFRSGALIFYLLLLSNAFKTTRRQPANMISIFLPSLCILFLFNPLFVTRNIVLQAFLPITFIILKGKIRYRIAYLVSLMGIIIVMPLLNAIGRSGESFASAWKNLDIFGGFKTIPFADVIDTLAFSIQWFGDREFFYGSKTLGLIFFFVPRALWPSKPTLTGLDIGWFLFFGKTSGTENLSFFVGGDFFADFGLVGVAFGAILLGVMTYYVFLYRSYRIGDQPIKIYILMGALPILIRGPFAANITTVFFGMIVLALVIDLVTCPDADQSTMTGVKNGNDNL